MFSDEDLKKISRLCLIPKTTCLIVPSISSPSGKPHHNARTSQYLFHRPPMPMLELSSTSSMGAPMAGYHLEFKRYYSPLETRQQFEICPIGKTQSSNIVDSSDQRTGPDQVPRSNLEMAASRIPAPGVSRNFTEPVNEVSSSDATCGTLSSHPSPRQPTNDVRNGLWSTYGASSALAICLRMLFVLFNRSAIHRPMASA